jgi:integrase
VFPISREEGPERCSLGLATPKESQFRLGFFDLLSRSYRPLNLEAAPGLPRDSFDDAVWPLAAVEPFWQDERVGIRQGFISYEEYLSILCWLPDHLKMLWCLAYHWGIRKGELLKLRWEWALPYVADDEPIIKVPGFDPKTKQRITKNGEPHTLPLYAPEMREYLKMALSSRNAACPYIFQYRGKQLKSPRTGFENARHNAELDHVLIHDMRRTAIRNMVKAGISRKRAMQISGHLTESVFNRYDIGTEDDAVESGVTLREYHENQKQKFAKRETKLVAELVADTPEPNSGVIQ